MSLLCRTTYAAESGLQKMESTKKEQDFLIDHLQSRIHYTERMRDVYNSQIKTQAGELRSAEETLSLAASEATGVQLEKKRLLGQWQSTLLSIQFRDDALKVLANVARFASYFILTQPGADKEMPWCICEGLWSFILEISNFFSCQHSRPSCTFTVAYVPPCTAF